MRRIILILILFFVFCNNVFSEDKVDEKKKPKKELKLTVSATHNYFSNWQGGGINSLAFSCKLNGDFIRISDRWEQAHDFELGIGVLKQEEYELQKSEDIIHYSYGLGYSAKKDSNISVFFNFDFRTQFSDGYNYKENPFEGLDEIPVKVSSLFSPAYFTESINMSYKRGKWLRTSLGLGLKQIIVEQKVLRELYGLKVDESIKVEFGISSKLKLKKEIVKNVLLDSQLDFFLSIAGEIKNPDVRWNNKFDMKINSWLRINFEFELFYDDDIMKDLQLREVMSLGIVLNII